MQQYDISVYLPCANVVGFGERQLEFVMQSAKFHSLHLIAIIAQNRLSGLSRCTILTLDKRNFLWGPNLLIRINFSSSIDKSSHAQ